MIIVNPQNLPLIDYRQLVPFQQNLKDLDTAQYEKLLRSIQKHGFFVPVFVWFHEDKAYIMDGHQRHRVLTHEEVVFENTNYQIPYIAIEAADEKEAKEKLLKVASQYGKVTPEGYDEFTFDLDLADLEDVHFDAIDLAKFAAEELETEDEPETEKPPKTCPHCGGKL